MQSGRKEREKEKEHWNGRRAEKENQGKKSMEIVDGRSETYL
jgi:hypothetical protein